MPPPGDMAFIGVSTGGSLINRLFPVWAGVLGLGNARLVGIDLPVGAPPRAIRDTVRYIAETDSLRGALVTTHKIAVHAHASDLFARFDRYADLLGEVGGISKTAAGLAGHAKDPITAGAALDRLVPRSWWRDHPAAEVLILGAGGAGLALAAHLLEGPADSRPRRIVLTDIDAGRLAHADRPLGTLGGAGIVERRRVAGAADTDALLAALAPASLVVNATGLGKDRPGSPLSDAARFPAGGAVWEFNYRGALDFLAQARAQAAARALTVGDGWTYFLYGWAHVIAEVYGLTLDDALFARLEAAAEGVR